MNKQSFNAVYELYADKIYRTALYYSKDIDAAEEITQEVFLKLYIHGDNIKDWNKVLAWMKLTAKNIALNHYKKSRRELPNEDIVTLKDGIFSSCSVEEEVSLKQYNQEKQELVEEILYHLYEENPLWYHATVLAYCFDKPQKEVAEELQMELQALHSMLYRVRQWIKKHYRSVYENVKDL